MRNVALLTSSGSQELFLPPRALQREFYPFFEYTLSQVRAGLIDTLVVDGRPGAGKTQFSSGFQRWLSEAGVPYLKVGMDDDTLPRSERGHKELPEYHPGLVAKEALLAHQKGGGSLSFLKYNGKTGNRDIATKIQVPSKEDALLIVEGVRSIEQVRQTISQLPGGRENRTQYVLLDEPSSVANRRRAQRDRIIKGLPEDEVIRRLEGQEGCIRTYYDDLLKDLSRGLHSNGHPTAHVNLDILKLQKGN